MSVISIHIPYDPVPWAAARIAHGYHAYDPREKDKRVFRYIIKEQYSGPLLEGYVALKFLFAFSIPKSASKKKQAQMLNGEIIPTRADCTNCQKLYEDCLKGIVFKDDRNVETIGSQKMYAPKGFVLIEIYTDRRTYHLEYANNN